VELLIEKKGLVLFVLFVGMIALAGCSQGPSEESEATEAPVTESKQSEENSQSVSSSAAAVTEGKNLYMNKGCGGCHGPNGEGVSGVGPGLKDLAGSQVELIDGSTVIADDSFIVKSITNPENDVVKGYIAMVNLGISESDALKILEYIKSL
tara:strand:+ start:1105 stop:1560 length:456 start_codon:yes stop_codon:yes gene_type:complete